ncbi:hypothetical protein BDR07DRAFT_1402083 [Suillus spraguei]|nr:hypothetical protein BDR07DRAFT_1402083 [Suillus spraguei]
MIFKPIAVFAAGIAATLAQTIELGYPQNGANLYSGQELDAQVILPVSIEGCIQVGIALGIKSCVDGSCPLQMGWDLSFMQDLGHLILTLLGLMAPTRSLPSLYRLTLQRVLLSLRSCTCASLGIFSSYLHS